MAKERQVPQDLTSGFEELPLINSRPIDVFIAPSQTPTNPAINDLINSLEKLNPSLSRYKQAEYEVFTKEQEAKAEKEFNKTKLGIKKAVKSGEIPVGASPEFINKWVALDLKRKARDFKTNLWAEYDAQNIMEHPDPDAFNIFFEKYSADFKTKYKLDGYNPVNLSDSFIPNTMNAYAELNSQHINGRVAVIEKKAKEDLGNEIFEIGKEGRLLDEAVINQYFLEEGFSKHIPEKNKRLIYIAENIYKETQALIDAGLDTADAQVVLRDSIANLAVQYEDEKLLKIFDYLPTVDGSRMSGSQATKTLIKDTKRTITQLRIERIDQEEKLKTIQDKHDTKAMITNVTSFIDDNGIENITIPQLYEFFEKGIETEDGRTVPIELTKRSQLLTYFQNYKNGVTLLEEDKNIINEFYTEIMANPNDPKIKEELINALGTDINDTTFKAINTFHNNAIANQGDSRMKTPEYLQLELDLDEIVGDYASGSADKALAIQAIKGLRIKAHEILAGNSTISNSEFLKTMENEADRILGKLITVTKLNKIIDARDMIGVEGTLLQSLKKIINENPAEYKTIFKIFNEQKILFKEYTKDNSPITKEEFEERMNELNNQLLEINNTNAN